MKLNIPSADPGLIAALETAKGWKVTEETLREQRVSFAYGNAPETSTKETVRRTAQNIRLTQPPQGEKE